MFHADTMQWTVVELSGSAPESRLDFATCTLCLRLPLKTDLDSSCVSRSRSQEAENMSSVGRSAVVQRSGMSYTMQHSGTSHTLHCCCLHFSGEYSGMICGKLKCGSFGQIYLLTLANFLNFLKIQCVRLLCLFELPQ